jgi:hypothetical protein
MIFMHSVPNALKMQMSEYFLNYVFLYVLFRTVIAQSV